MYDADALDNRNDALVRRTVGLVDRLAVPYHRATVDGVERVPDGPALFVGNHNGATLSIDTFIFCAALYEEYGMEAVPRGLAHDLVVDLPVLNHLICQLGGVRASHDNARRVFEAGQKIIVYPGGDLEACRPYRRRNEIDFDGRTGFARLAIRNGVPIVPFVAAGAHETLVIFHDFRSVARRLGLTRRFRYGVFPLAFMLPWGLWFGPLPPYFPLPAHIRIDVLEPIEVEGGEDAANDEEYVAMVARMVEARMQLALTRLTSGSVCYAPSGGSRLGDHR